VWDFSRLAALTGKRITEVVAGCNSTHCIAIDGDGSVFAWGRNNAGQLGLGDRVTRMTPTKVEFKGCRSKCVAAGSGKNHSLFLMEDGTCYAAGSNVRGQLALGTVKKNPAPGEDEIYVAPRLCKAPGNTKAIVCTDDSTFFLTSEGHVFSCGHPEHGVLGHGTDNQYNTKVGTIKMAFDPQPNPRFIEALKHYSVIRIAAGAQHVAVTTACGKLFTWGFGDYGRLGHSVQKDEFAPKPIEKLFNYRLPTIDLSKSLLSCGSMTTFISSPEGAVWYAGKTKPSGESNMYFKANLSLGQYIPIDMACGNGTFYLSGKMELWKDGQPAPKKDVISWGMASNGELGFGRGQEVGGQSRAYDDVARGDGVEDGGGEWVCCGDCGSRR
jgi:alpha-tubulin suppressor-like RCC1 family protein